MIWSFRKGETEYALSHCSLWWLCQNAWSGRHGPQPAQQRRNRPGPSCLLSQKRRQRMAIISAGVIMNIITAILFFTYAFSSGIENPTAVIGSVQAGLPAWEKGMQAGDQIVEINGRKVNSFLDIKRGVASLPEHSKSKQCDEMVKHTPSPSIPRKKNSAA
ncbi:MAG: M50 family metallopeptidase [Planctomycetaceae bacterium]